MELEVAGRFAYGHLAAEKVFPPSTAPWRQGFPLPSLPVTTCGAFLQHMRTILCQIMQSYSQLH